MLGTYIFHLVFDLIFLMDWNFVISPIDRILVKCRVHLIENDSFTIISAVLFKLSAVPIILIIYLLIFFKIRQVKSTINLKDSLMKNKEYLPLIVSFCITISYTIFIVPEVIVNILDTYEIYVHEYINLLVNVLAGFYPSVNTFVGIFSNPQLREIYLRVWRIARTTNMISLSSD